MDDTSCSETALYCIVPAAGLSSRMGAWKPLLPWGATTVLGAVVERVIAAGLRPLVVAGYRSDELVAAFGRRPELDVVVNGDWESGMLGSIRAGLASVPDGAPGFFVLPADMPRIPVQAFSIVVGEARRLEALGLAQAVFASKSGRLGHPVWIPAAFRAGIAALDPDSRLRDYLLALSWTSVEIDDDGIFDDLDTPEAYAAAIKLILTE